MKTMTLGEKIRRRRKQLGMTQADLSGDYITRNMISRMETGDINPSLETLRYLAEKLEVPCGYLLSPQDDLITFLKPSIMQKVQAFFREKRWRDAVSLCEEYGLDKDAIDDEIGMLLCECAVQIGLEAYSAGDTADAGIWFDRALSFAEKTAYHTEIILSEAILCKAMLAELAGETPKPFLDTYSASIGRAVNVERFLLLRFFYEMEHGETERAIRAASILGMENNLYHTLIIVWQYAAEQKTAEARSLLETIFAKDDTDTLSELKRDPLLLYRCIVKMEQLAAAMDDYKAAYQYAAKRQQIEKRYHIQ
ncbi:MAG: helix-turn-helix transcriptional regulator [Clostridia bacterium]|nr:helix-turn-helix transcriptional regulator [Clostridia bacterium]